MDRLDVIIVRRGLTESREKAQALIMAGEVMVDGKKVDKPGTRVGSESEIELLSRLPYVSRGGYKLAHALDEFAVDVKGRDCLDAGASTGGFTDCLLQRGARSVIAVDVGYGQLAWKLRQDPRVRVMEKTNIRYLTPDRIDGVPTLITADLSFISLTKVLGTLVHLLPDRGEIIALIKPQFEAGREKVGKKGVVRDQEVHLNVLAKILSAGEEAGLGCGGLTPSPILGPEGNIEFFIYWRKGEKTNPDPLIEETVKLAWKKLKTGREISH